MLDTRTHTGSCLCGALSYKVSGPLSSILICHCTQCRKTSGHFAAATAARKSDFQLINQEGLEWYRSSPQARRGFCKKCGSSVLWQSDNADYIVLFTGSLDDSSGLKIMGHIFTDTAGKYYRLDDAPILEHDAIHAEWPDFPVSS